MFDQVHAFMQIYRYVCVKVNGLNFMHRWFESMKHCIWRKYTGTPIVPEKLSAPVFF